MYTLPVSLFTGYIIPKWIWLFDGLTFNYFIIVKYFLHKITIYVKIAVWKNNSRQKQLNLEWMIQQQVRYELTPRSRYRIYGAP